MCLPGAKPNDERPINPVPILDSPVASQLSICTQVTVSLPCARLTDRSANTRRVIDVTESWLSNGSDDPLSRYRPPGQLIPYLHSLKSIAGRLLLHYVDQTNRINGV